jgi:hypothetical protein
MAQDLDETRRLLYMAYFAPRTPYYVLAGTIVNALRHHQGVDDTELEESVLALLSRSAGADLWFRNQLTRIERENDEADGYGRFYEH